jgi:hypothetical protein
LNKNTLSLIKQLPFQFRRNKPGASSCLLLQRQEPALGFYFCAAVLTGGQDLPPLSAAMF